MKRFAFIFLAGLSLYASPALAQDGDAENIVVTGTMIRRGGAARRDRATSGYRRPSSSGFSVTVG